VFGTGLHADKFQGGSFAEYVLAPVDIVAHLPDEVSFEVGAAVALVGVTAWRALVQHATLQPGEDCLVHGGSGGVGHVAVQLAATTGASVTVTAGSRQARQRVRELGADTVARFDDETLRETIGDSFDGGADVILDHRVNEYLPFGVDISAFGGRVVVYGGSEGTVPDGLATRAKELSVYWMSMSNLVDTANGLPTVRSVLSDLAVLLERGAVTADVARTYDLSQAVEAHRAVLEDSFVGKLTVTP